MAFSLYPTPRVPSAVEVATGALAIQEAYNRAEQVAQGISGAIGVGKDIMKYIRKPITTEERNRANKRARTIARHLRGGGGRKKARLTRRKKSILVDKAMPTQKQKKALVRYAKNIKTTKPRRKPNLAKQVKAIKKSLKTDQARHTYKISEAGPLLASVSKCNHRAFSLGTISNLQTAMANFRYYDPADPANPTTADASTGTYSRHVHCLGITYSITARNNYQVPCKYKIYKVQPKADTSIDAITYFTNGITDQVQSTLTKDDTLPQIHLTEIDSFMSQWNAKVLRSGILEPGRQVSATFKSKAFDFDPSVFDTHNLDYQTKYGSGLFIVRVEGVIGHDTTVADYTTLQAGLDLEGTRIYKFVYDAGTSLNDIYVADSRDTTFTNAGVVANKPVSDNQSYSVA